MHVVTYQPHADRGLAAFAQQARGLEVGQTMSPGFARLGCLRCQPPQLSGLGDWFTDGINALTQSGVSIIGAVTGSTAQAEAQRNAVAIANAQAAADMAQTQAFMSAIPWVAGAIGIVGLGLILTRK